jgi:hypothetical protein
MPEYLSPGVYVEEVSFRSKSIQGVPTSTTGFAGMTRFGPVQYNDDGVHRGPSTSEPRLVTSFTEFERIYGGLEPLVIDGDERTCFLAHAARAFFMNGGQRLYVSRVFAPLGPADPPTDFGVANMLVTVDGPSTATWRARWPGQYGNETWLEVRATRTGNVAFQWPDDPLDPLDRHLWGVQAKSARNGTIVEIIDPPPAPPDRPPKENDDFAADTLAVVHREPTGQQTFRRGGANVAVNPGAIIQIVELSVTVRVDDAAQRVDFYDKLSTDPRQLRFIGKVLQRDDPADENAVVWLDLDEWDTSDEDAPIALLLALRANFGFLTNGHDGGLVSPDDIRGAEADPDVVTVKATGLEALGEIDDIAIVAVPDAGTYDDVTLCQVASQALIDHAEKFRYRIAVVDGPKESSITEIRAFRGQFDTTRGAIYHPWIEIFDPLQRPAQGVPPPRILLPPSGFVTGIYARSDVQRGVERGRERPHAVRDQHQPAAPGRPEPGGHQRAALFRGTRQPCVGGPHDDVRSGVDLRQRAPPLHLPRALDRQVDAVGGVRAEQRTALGEHPLHDRGLPPPAVEERRPHGNEAGGGLLRPLRPDDDDAERLGQRAPRLPHRRVAAPASGVRHFPHRPENRRRARLSAERHRQGERPWPSNASVPMVSSTSGSRSRTVPPPTARGRASRKSAGSAWRSRWPSTAAATSVTTPR